MTNAKLGTGYDDKFAQMELGKLRATVEEQQAEIERLKEMHPETRALIERDAEIERLREGVTVIQVEPGMSDKYQAMVKRVEKLEKVFDAAKVYWDNTPDTTYSQAVALRDAIADAEASK